MARIRLNSLTKKYGETLAVDNVNLDIADSEFLVLVGPSGCGKTTTLRMLAGLEDISSGQIYIGDRLVNDVEPKDRDIAMVFQNYALYPHMNVYDNMAFGLRMRKIGEDEIVRRIGDAAALLGLDRLLKRRPRELSGGQRQRVALGRAIVREATVFLMDEPLSNLDAQLRVQTRTEILRLHNRLQNTVVYVTHDQVEAMTMGDRIAVMKDGIVQQVASPREIYDRPVNRFVAGFIGSPPMNFIDAELQVQGNIAHLRAPAFTLSVNGAMAARLQESRTREITIGVRPEDISVAAAAAPEANNSITARVDVVETLGSEQHLLLAFNGETLLARVGPDFRTSPGQNIGVVVDAGSLHVFDRSSGVAYI
jgi:multiple sugar transport system ATP-binding protein